jgi:hypothetical protein
MDYAATALIGTWQFGVNNAVDQRRWYQLKEV